MWKIEDMIKLFKNKLKNLKKNMNKYRQNT